MNLIFFSLAEASFLRLGPIPAGTPIDLIANTDLDLSDDDKAFERVRLLVKVQRDLIQIKLQHLNADASRRVLENLVPDLLKISKCPDFVLDRGHYFGTSLPDQDKLALIEFLKTF